MTAGSLRRPRWPLLVAIAFAVVAVIVTWAWNTDSGYFAYLPDKAHATAPIVSVPGGTAQKSDAGIYFVDVSVLKANEVQKLWAEHLVHGATLVPDTALLVPGESEQQRITEDARAMADSKTTAQVVAEQALGMDVRIAQLGSQILELQKGDPAANAGIKPGAIITEAQGDPVHDSSDLVHALAGVKPGQTITLALAGGRHVHLRTIPDPSNAHHAIVGIAIGDAVHVTHIPVKVSISTPGIGGPSAGLAFALEIYDSLSHRTLLHGHKVAATGELDLAGGVHAIGGVKQKTIGAIEAGADTFLVPEGNLKDAQAAADGHIKVIGVGTFRQALAAIRGL